MKPLPFVVFVVGITFAALCSAQRSDLAISKDAGKNPWTNLSLNNDPKTFQFAVVSDRTGGHRAGVFEDAVRKLNLLQPEFVMSVGDMIEGYSKDPKEIDAMWDEFQSFVAKLKMPFFYVPGNHDLSNEVEHREWAKRFGRKYYHFVYRDVLFLCLNSEDPVTRISPEQIEYVRKALDENKNVRWTLVFLHQPLWLNEARAAVAATKPSAAASAKPEKEIGWDEIEKLLAAGDRKYTVFAGHIHDYTKTVRHDRRYITLASTGAGSRLRGVPFGEFDHVAWVTMTDDGPVLANLMLSGIWDEDVATDESRRRVAHLVDAARVLAPIVESDADSLGGPVTAQVKLINDADIPLTVSGRFAQSEQLRPDPYVIEAVVPPNSVKLVDVRLDPRQRGADASELEPVGLNVSLSYDLGARGKLEVQKVISVGVDHPLPIIKRPASSPVVVDGKLDEWGELPIPCSRPAHLRGDTAAWKGPTDGSFRFGVAMDDKNLYVAVDVTDDRVLLLEGRTNAEAYDGIEVRLDARPAAKRTGKAAADTTKYGLIAVCPGDASGKGAYLAPGPAVPAGTRYAAVTTPKGYAVEIAVPLDYVRKTAGTADWTDLRINVAQNDRDQTTKTLAELWWRPRWQDEESTPRSGTFKRP
jgi:hypothetical protein